MDLLLPDNVVFTCQQSGACCRNDWLIGVDDGAVERLRRVDWRRLDPSLPSGEPFPPLPFPLPSGERRTLARTSDGACVFLTRDSRCAIHRLLGADAKPQVCREFPYSFVRTPDGVAVGVSFACTAVRAHQGQRLAEQRDEIEAVLAASRRVRELPEALVLYGDLEIPWSRYRAIEAALIDLVTGIEWSPAVGLLAGSALVSVAVGLTHMERRAQRAGCGPTDTLEEALAALRAERYARLIAVAAGARCPRRPALAALAPLFTWLEFSRRRMSRVALVAALYRNYFRFRRGRGRLPDIITGGPPFDIGDLTSVGFDPAAPDIAPFVREYWSHVVFRKTVVPMHGVFRGWQTLIVLYAFTKWAAKLVARRRGRAEVALDDLRDAVRLVEQSFVLHARFADVFSLSPLLTLMADRLYRDPRFVRAAVLEPSEK